MEPLPLHKIDAVNTLQFSEAANKKTTAAVRDSQGIFRQTLNAEATALEKPRTEHKTDRVDDPAAVEKSLEKMVISLMMKPMFAEFAEFTFGKGVEADVYSSLFSDAVADEIATGGSFGLGKYTQNLNLHDKSSVK